MESSTNPIPCVEEESSVFSRLAIEHRLDMVMQLLPDDRNGSQRSVALKDWFAALLDELERTGSFRELRRKAIGFEPIPGRPTLTETLWEEGPFRLSLIALNPRKPVPLHDHPYTWSAQLLLDGDLRITHFDLAPGSSQSPSMVYLEKTADSRLKAGDISFVTPDYRNIHALTAADANAVLLSIQYPPCTLRRQSWYFPADEEHMDRNSILCHRLQRKHHKPPATQMSGETTRTTNHAQFNT